MIEEAPALLPAFADLPAALCKMDPRLDDAVAIVCALRVQKSTIDMLLTQQLPECGGLPSWVDHAARSVLRHPAFHMLMYWVSRGVDQPARTNRVVEHLGPVMPQLLALYQPLVTARGRGFLAWGAVARDAEVLLTPVRQATEWRAP